MRYIGLLCATLAIGTMFIACSEKKADPIRRGPHPAGFVDKTSESFHGTRVRDVDMGGNASCLECHTVVAADSTADAIAMSCANSPGCHARSVTATSLNCGTCHARSELPPSHQEHFAAGADACALCHAATYSTTGALLDSVHMNAVLNVALSVAVEGTFSASEKTCSDSRCHGITQPNTSPAWGASAALTCQSCHAIDDLSDMHDTHFAQSAANCGICHASTAINATSLQPETETHANLTVDVVFATTHGGTFDAGAGTCSDTHCHGVGATSPAWTGTTDLDCQSCHAFADLPDAHGSHLAKNDDCSVCHSMTAVGNSAISNPAFHGNLEKDVALSAVVQGEFVAMTQTCTNTSCHGTASPPWTSTVDLDCNSCHAKAELPGAHQAHFARSPANCETCHSTTATDSSAIKDPSLHMNFTVDVALIDGIDGAYDSTTETCSNTYCHLDATPTPPWSGSTDLRCQSCHSYASLADPHPPHVSFVSNDCSVCHSETVSGPYTMINPSLHADQIVQVAMSGSAGAGATYDDLTNSCADTYCHVSGTPTWSVGVSLDCNSCHAKAELPGAHQAHFARSPANCETCHSTTATDSSAIKDPLLHMNYAVDVAMIDGIDGTYDPATETCSNTYCHLDATPTPAWNGTTDLRCQSCHSYASLPEPHPVHVDLVSNDCSVCHSETVSGPYTMINPSIHADQTAQVAMNDVVNGTYDTQTSSCADTYCHRSGTPVWTTAALDCNSCHAVADLPVSHPAHFKSMEQNCAVCHASTAQDSTGIAVPANHVNFQVEVALADAFGGVFDGTTNTCSNTYCHFEATTTPWDNPTDLRCQGCHPYSTLPDNHGIHIDTFGNICGTCHANTVSGGYSLVDRGKHANLTAEVAIVDSLGGTYSIDTGTCANNWCHGPRNDVVSPAWTGTTDLDCQGCHPTASLSVGHPFHVTTMGQPCQNCHNATAVSPTELVVDGPHVDGTVQVVGTYTNMVYDLGANTCSSSQNPCHNPGPSKNWFTLE